MNRSLLVRSTGYGVRRFLLRSLYAVLCTALLSGCVRLSGGAGYWKTEADGNTVAKRASFDTANYVPGSPAPGKVTV